MLTSSVLQIHFHPWGCHSFPREDMSSGSEILMDKLQEQRKLELPGSGEGVFASHTLLESNDIQTKLTLQVRHMGNSAETGQTPCLHSMTLLYVSILKPCIFLKNAEQKLSFEPTYLPKAHKTKALKRLHFFHISIITSASQIICKSLINFTESERGSIHNQSVMKGG